MADKATGDLRDGVKKVFDSSPAVQIVNAVASIGEAANTAVDKVKRAFNPILPGQTPPARRTRDIQLPKEKKR